MTTATTAFRAMARNNAWANQRLLGACARLDDARLFGETHAMLAGTDVKPPQLDAFFMANEASLWADEFEALGWREADVWGGPDSAS